MRALSVIILTAYFAVTALTLSFSPQLESREQDRSHKSTALPGFYIQFERCHACSYEDWQRDTAMALEKSGIHAFVSDVITSYTSEKKFETIKKLPLRSVRNEGWPIPVFGGPFALENQAKQIISNLPSILKPALEKFIKENPEMEKAVASVRQLENCSGNHCEFADYTINLVYIQSTGIAEEKSGSPASTRRQTIPKQFQGAWDGVEGKVNRCKYGLDSDSRFTVASTAITYYEARCKLRKVGTSNHNTFTGSFDCEGENQQWSQEISLTLDGVKLFHKGLGTGISRNSRCN
jgi:hypothetical protein